MDLPKLCMHQTMPARYEDPPSTWHQRFSSQRVTTPKLTSGLSAWSSTNASSAKLLTLLAAWTNYLKKLRRTLQSRYFNSGFLCNEHFYNSVSLIADAARISCEQLLSGSPCTSAPAWSERQDWFSWVFRAPVPWSPACPWKLLSWKGYSACNWSSQGWSRAESKQSYPIL